MIDLYVFDIPIYRLSEDQYNAQMEKHISKRLYDPLGNGSHHDIEQMKQFLLRNPGDEIFRKDHLWKKYGGAWRFNELVGHIRLFLTGRQIRGQLWEVDAKRIIRTRNKRFIWKTDKVVPELDIDVASSSREVFNTIMEYIENVKKEKIFSNRYIDTRIWELIGPYVDWKAIILDKSSPAPNRRHGQAD